MVEANNKLEETLPWYSGKTSARFLAAQFAYSMMFKDTQPSGSPAELAEHLYEVREVLGIERVDRKLLLKILEVMVARGSEIDAIISENVSNSWSVDRINLVSMSIIKAGICELLCSCTNTSIIINEYVDIASYSLEDSEIDFVNAMLNKAKHLRTTSDTQPRNASENCKSSGLTGLLPEGC